MRLPIQVQIYIYRKLENKIEYLLLKRIAERHGFWQAVTGGLEEGEDLKTCALREVAEETSIIEYLDFFGPYYVFQFVDCPFYGNILENEKINLSAIDNKKLTSTEFVFAMEISENEKVDFSNNIYVEHEEFKWCSFQEALSLLKYDSGKGALKLLNNILVDKIK